MIDISEEGILLRYLKDKRIFANIKALRVRYFSGGVSGTVALAADGEKSVVVKQALPFLKVAARWECDPRRMIVEQRALEVYERLIPQSVPRPIFFDEENYIMVREAAPENCPMWKEQLLEGALDFNIARQSIEALLTVHNETAGDAEVRHIFHDDAIFHSLRINPYIETVMEKYPAIAEKGGRIIDVLMNEKISLVHGDYSPKNILVDGGRIFILDMEVAHYGHPAFDIAFFANHFILKSVKNKAWSDAYLNMLRYMLGIYFGGVSCMKADALECDTVGTLGFLLLARVDGKSPAEYITAESDKQLIRRMALQIIEQGMSDFGAVIGMVKREL